MVRKTLGLKLATEVDRAMKCHRITGPARIEKLQANSVVLQ
jgi:hypothetical protein